MGGEGSRSSVRERGLFIHPWIMECMSESEGGKQAVCEGGRAAAGWVTVNQPQLGKDRLLVLVDVKRQRELSIREKKVKETTGSGWRLVGRHTAVDNCATISGSCDRPKTLPRAGCHQCHHR